MSRRARALVRLLLSGLLVSSTLASPARPARAAELPAVARPVVHVGRETQAAGTAFFIPAPGEVGVAAVAVAHAFDAAELARAREVEFKLGRSGRRVSVSSAHLTAPGRPFRETGASLRGDFMVFALDLKPSGVRVLEPEPTFPRPGDRVRLLGVPSQIPQDEDDLFGTVKDVSEDRIEVDLDTKADLRGWGGAPVLTYPAGHVLGILEAARPIEGTLRVSVSPIGAVLEALKAPLDGGRGRPFAAFAPGGPPAAATASAQAPAASGAPSSVAGAAPPTNAPSSRGTAPAGATKAPAAGGPEPSVRPDPARTAAVLRPAGQSLLGRPGPEKAVVRLSLEKPTAGEVFGDANGAFVSGRALALLGPFRKFDVAIVIDTSGSTAEPSGADINGNGVVGRGRGGGIGSIFGLGSSDPGDSVLAAEVAAARKLLDGLDPRNTRVALITFAGTPPDDGFFGRGVPNAAITEEPLTTDYARVRHALDMVLDRGPEGATHMAAGVDQATIELLGLRGGLSKPDKESEKVVLFLTDGQPTLPYGPGFERDNVRAVLRAADRAHRAGIKIDSFGLGQEALEGPVSCVEMASRTGGYFTPLRTPGDVVAVVDHVSFANIESVRVRNETTGADADEVTTSADGSFGALVSLRPGPNTLSVIARTNDGSEGRQVVDVTYVAGAPEVTLSPALMAQRNRLLEQKLLDLRRGRIAAEREKAEQARKELALEIERERAKAQDRAAQQRKQLDLEVEREDTGSAPAPAPAPSPAPAP